MTTPTTKSYNEARWAAIKKFETTGKPDSAFYLDGSGFVTVGYGTLVTKNGVINPNAEAVVSNSSDPVLAQKMVDGFAGSKGSVAEVKASLEGKGFVFEGSKIVGFKDGVDVNGKPVITDIKNVLPEAGAIKVTEGTSFPEKEKLVDGIEARLKMHFTEDQRAAVLSRVYNGVPGKDEIDALADKGTPEAALAMFASNRGGENGANPGHYARTIEEAREFLGDSVKAATVGNAKGFTYTDKDGSEVFIGSQAEKIGGTTKAEFVAYKVVTNDDQTQTQVPLGLTSLGKKGSMQFVDASHLPLDPVVELNNATLSGDPSKILTALTLDPAIKTPQAALDALRQHNPELGEPQDINLGTDAKPVWAKGYVLTDDDGKTTILAVSKDSKGKAALVGYEIDPVTETNPDPAPHAIPVSSPQSKIPALKVSDAGELSDPDTVVADASADLPDIGTLPTFGPGVQVADAGDFTGAGTMTDAGWIPAGGSGLSSTSASAPTPASPNNFTNYLDAQGSNLTTAQQAALATQIDKLNLGGEGALSFYSLPNGGALIANADGDIVGEINRSASGSLNLKANGIDAQGNTVDVNQHISLEGESLNQAQYNAQAQQQANASVNLFNSLMAAQQWDQLDDMGKLAVLANVYSAVDTLGGELPGDLGGLASVLSLMQGLDSGNDLMVLRSSLQLGQMGLDAYSDYMADLAMQMADEMLASTAVDAASSAAMDAAAEAALESAAASNAAGQAVPYVSYVMALQNFEEHSEQAIGTIAGTYIGQAIGSYFGPIGAAIGGAFGGMFGDDDPPPPPEGAAHFSWDANGQIQHTVDYNQSGGGDVANQVAASVQGLLEQVVQAINDKTPSTADDVAINPYLIPKVGFSGSSAWIEVSLSDGRAGNLQAFLTIDFNGDGVIQTRDKAANDAEIRNVA